MAVASEIWLDDYGAVGDGVTYDDSALASAQSALSGSSGAYGGVIKLTRQKTYRFSSFTLQDNIIIDGCGQIPSQPRGGTPAYDFSDNGARILLDGGVLITATTANLASSGTSLLQLTTWSTNYQVGGAIYGADGILPGTSLTGTLTSNNQWNLSFPLSANVAAGTTVKLASVGIVLGNGSGLRGVQIMRYGMVTPPPDTASAQAEIDSWADKGNAIYMQGYDCLLQECLIIGFRNAVVINRVARHRIERVGIDCMNGLLLGSTGDFPYFSDINCWPYYTANQSAISGGATTNATSSGGSSVTPASLSDGAKIMTLYRSGVGIGLMNNSADVKLNRCFVYGYNIDFYIRNSNDVTFLNCYADHILSLTAPDPINKSGSAWVVGTGFQVDGACRNVILVTPEAYSCTIGYKINISSLSSFERDVAFLFAATSTQATDKHVSVLAGGVSIHGMNIYGGSGYAGATPIYAPAAGSGLGVRQIALDDVNIYAVASTVTAFDIDSSVLPYFSKRGGRIETLADPYGERITGLLALGVANGLTATGTTAATALTLGSNVNIFTTVASGTGAVVPAVVGASVTIINAGANALKVYPAAGTIGSAASVSIAAGGRGIFVCATATQFYQVG